MGQCARVLLEASVGSPSPFLRLQSPVSSAGGFMRCLLEAGFSPPHTCSTIALGCGGPHRFPPVAPQSACPDAGPSAPTLPRSTRTMIHHLRETPVPV